MQFWKKAALLTAAAFLCLVPFSGQAAGELEGLKYPSKAALLIEQETGTVLYEKNTQERYPIASVTKVMTLCLIFEQVDSGALSLEDRVTVSKNAESMGGSQVFLEENGAYTVDALIKSIVVASANDASVAMAEHLAGNEDAFVIRMNDQAAQWGMLNTQFANATGLPSKNAYSSANDVAIMSQKLLQYADFYRYSKIWTDSITHPGGRVTELANTNKLVRFYDGCDGLKTGSTAEAGFCLSATAEKGGVRYIAVVLGSSTSQERFDEARTLLNYGFANYALQQVADGRPIADLSVNVKTGVTPKVAVQTKAPYSALVKKGAGSDIRVEYHLPVEVEAPVMKGDVLGEMLVYEGEKLVARLELVAAGSSEKIGFWDALDKLIKNW